MIEKSGNLKKDGSWNFSNGTFAQIDNDYTSDYTNSGISGYQKKVASITFAKGDIIWEGSQSFFQTINTGLIDHKFMFPK